MRVHAFCPGGSSGRASGLLVVSVWRAAGVEWNCVRLLLRRRHQPLCPAQCQQHVEGDHRQRFPNAELPE